MICPVSRKECECLKGSIRHSSCILSAQKTIESLKVSDGRDARPRIIQGIENRMKRSMK